MALVEMVMKEDNCDYATDHQPSVGNICLLLHLQSKLLADTFTAITISTSYVILNGA
jgi:hypothetical protein